MSYTDSLDNTFRNTSSYITNSFDTASSTLEKTYSSSSLPESNTLVAKFAFLLLVVIVFVVLLRLGSWILGLLFTPSASPTIIDGMIDSKQMMIIPQDPGKKGAIPILRSVNDIDGLEFTWSTWIYVKDFSYKQHRYKHIFHKGNDSFNEEGLNFPNNAPGLYISPDTNNLVVMMNTFDNYSEKITVHDLPMQKWVNVVIRVIQHQLDIYINGTLTKRHILQGVPKQNYGDVYVSMNGGFSGYTSDLKYFNYGIGTNKIQSIVDSGPNMKMLSSNMTSSGENAHYLSTRWYFKGSEDMYNP